MRDEIAVEAVQKGSLYFFDQILFFNLLVTFCIAQKSSPKR
jgi:hypothetical protein